MWVPSLGWEDLLQEEMATHFSILAWKIPSTEEPGGLQSMGSQSRIPLSTHSTETAIAVSVWMTASTPYVRGVSSVIFVVCSRGNKKGNNLNPGETLEMWESLAYTGLFYPYLLDVLCATGGFQQPISASLLPWTFAKASHLHSFSSRLSLPRIYSVQEQPSINDVYPMSMVRWKCAFALFPQFPQ